MWHHRAGRHRQEAGRVDLAGAEVSVDLGLEGRVALVGGGSRGLGRASARELLREGASVLLVARDRQRLTEAVGGLVRDGEQLARRQDDHLDPVTADDADIWLSGSSRRRRLPAVERVDAFAADLSQPDEPARAVAAAVERFGRLDVVVVNAGGPPVGRFEEIGEELWDRAVATTFLSAVRLVRAAIPHLREPRVRQAGGGRIVFIASSSAKSPIANLVTSNALRPAIVGLMKTLSVELAADGILVNAVAPGRIATERLVQLDADTAARTGQTVEEVAATAASRIPLGRYGDPAELGVVVAFLASARASYVTGTLVTVDGGSTRTLL
jgi:3-oxoacyl-[acyl-carrier protein] reductase